MVITMKVKAPETSKFIVYLMLFLYVGIVVYSAAIYIFTGDYPKDLVETVSYPVIIITTGYYGKATFENSRKYKNVNDNSDCSEEDDIVEE
jgi:hypothetical protein